MSRHRNVRSLRYSEEEDDYDDLYGHSFEEDYCISPGTAAQFTYDRGKNRPNMANFLRTHDDNSLGEISEENIKDESEEIKLEEQELQFYDPDTDALNSCIEEIRKILGNTIPESDMVEAIKKHHYNIELALDALLTSLSQQSKKNESDRKFNSPNEASKTNIENISTHDSKENTKSNAPKDYAFIKSKEPSKPEPQVLSEKIAKSANDTPSKVEQPEEVTPIKPPKATKTSEELLSEYNQIRGKEKPLLNLVVIGHVDAGKSTLMGHLLFKLGHVSKKLMHKYKQESQKIGKSSFVYAWILDETEEERNRGITTEVAQTRLESENRTINLLDAPGHKDFIPHMITGASQADVAILVVDATKGEFETGFESGGQTREHTLLIRSLGVSQLAVAINKMDNINWSKERFDEIVKKLSTFLKQAGYKESEITYVPCSGLQGENLVVKSEIPELKSWYSGPCLLDVIDSFKPPERLLTKPFRFCINDIFKGAGSSMCVAGKIEAGSVQAGDKLLLMPNGEMILAKNIMIDDNIVAQGFAGDYVTITLANVDPSILSSGGVLCDPHNPIKASSLIQVRIVTFNLETPLTQGCEVVLHYQNVSEQAHIRKIRSQLHKSTGQVVKKHPRFLPKNSSGVVELEVARPICVELYKDFKELGRVMLRFKGTTIAAGLVTKIH